MAELVTVSIKNHVADVRFNRPDKYNALSLDMVAAIANTINRLAKESAVRAVVVSGEGKGFCAGLDFENFALMQSKEGNKITSLTDRYENRITNIFQHIAYGWKQLPMPVIAAIHGVALGGGCQIALGADIRFCTPDAKFSIMEMRWGLIPDMSASQTIRDLVSIDVAKELIFTGKIIKGEEAARLKLVTRVCEKPHEEAMILATEIASQNPEAIRAAKKLLNEVWHGDSARGLSMESELEMTLIGTPNQLEAVSANFEKRTPTFKDLA
jgi:enoyl-CoA hydratase/carnithine racemase